MLSYLKLYHDENIYHRISSPAYHFAPSSHCCSTANWVWWVHFFPFACVNFQYSSSCIWCGGHVNHLADGKSGVRHEITNVEGNDGSNGRIWMPPIRRCFGGIGRGCVLPPPSPVTSCGANHRCYRRPPTN